MAAVWQGAWSAQSVMSRPPDGHGACPCRRPELRGVGDSARSRCAENSVGAWSATPVRRARARARHGHDRRLRFGDVIAVGEVPRDGFVDVCMVSRCAWGLRDVLSPRSSGDCLFGLWGLPDLHERLERVGGRLIDLQRCGVDAERPRKEVRDGFGARLGLVRRG